MTKQEVFDKVATHLLRQGRPSKATFGGGGYRGAYRSKGGLKCAIGVLIPDDRYHKGLEGCSVKNAKVKASLDGVVDYGECYPLLKQLQFTHDQRWPEQWADCLAYIAGEHKLNANALEAATDAQ